MAELQRPEPRVGPASNAVGPGRVLVVVYAFFVLAAGARSGVQLATQFAVAPLAYLLSALASVVYLVATVLLVRVERRPAADGRVAAARALCFVELGGVVGVGLVSVLVSAWFPRPSVWSGFGSGYGFVPLVLPVVALWWLHRPGQAARE